MLVLERVIGGLSPIWKNISQILSLPICSISPGWKSRTFETTTYLVVIEPHMDT